jgi:hypothetical protein
MKCQPPRLTGADVLEEQNSQPDILSPQKSKSKSRRHSQDEYDVQARGKDEEKSQDKPAEKDRTFRRREIHEDLNADFEVRHERDDNDRTGSRGEGLRNAEQVNTKPRTRVASTSRRHSAADEAAAGTERTAQSRQVATGVRISRTSAGATPTGSATVSWTGAAASGDRPTQGVGGQGAAPRQAATRSAPVL